MSTTITRYYAQIQRSGHFVPEGTPSHVPAPGTITWTLKNWGKDAGWAWMDESGGSIGAGYSEEEAMASIPTLFGGQKLYKTRRGAMEASERMAAERLRIRPAISKCVAAKHAAEQAEQQAGQAHAALVDAVRAAVADGASGVQLARSLKVSEMTISRWAA